MNKIKKDPRRIPRTEYEGTQWEDTDEALQRMLLARIAELRAKKAAELTMKEIQETTGELLAVWFGGRK